MNRFNNIFSILQETAPSMDIGYKDESRFMSFLSVLLFFNKEFKTNFITTIPFTDTIYFPDRETISLSPYSATVTVTHEWKHIRDSHKYNPLVYSLMYLFPQILALAIIPLAFILGWWALFALLFLAPLPAYGRAFIERRGYAMSLFSINEILKERNVSAKHRAEHLISYAKNIDQNHFRGADYYWMWPFGMGKYLDNVVKQIISGDILDIDEDFKIVQEAFIRSKDIQVEI